jgi:hypothetical protein
MGDGTAEIATLSQKLAALAVAETDKDHAFRLFTSQNADKAKGAPTLDDMRERTAALLRGMNNPVEG